MMKRMYSVAWWANELRTSPLGARSRIAGCVTVPTRERAVQLLEEQLGAEHVRSELPGLDGTGPSNRTGVREFLEGRSDSAALWLNVAGETFSRITGSIGPCDVELP